MPAKTYRRFPLRVLRPRDQILGGTSNWYPVGAGGADIFDSFPVKDTGAGLLEIADASQDAIVAFSMQDAQDKNGVALASGTDIETFLANDPSQTWLEGNLLSGVAGAQIDYVLQQTDLFGQVTFTWDPNYLGAGLGGYYFDVINPGGGVGALDGRGNIVSFINTRVPSNQESSVSVPGDTNAVVRVQLYDGEYLLGTIPQEQP